MQAEKLPNRNTPSPPPPGDGPREDGLRSGAAIRWLLFVGALVVGVSVVRLVASQWGSLDASVQFTLLSLGNLALFGFGSVARDRLHLRVAGSAILGLFATLTPVLAWGAARQSLVTEPLGAVATFGGLAACGWALRRLVAHAFDYRGPILPAALGFYLFALPAAPFFVAAGVDASLVASAMALAGGGLLALACRHVNRFFFHRDRREGIERPLSYLPFAMLVALYAASVLALAPDVMGIALLVLFVAFALIDAGEEYVLAVERTSGKKLASWPRRSKGLLTFGFVGLAVAVALVATNPEISDAVDGSLLDPPTIFNGVLALAGTRLLFWAFRHRSSLAYFFGLPLLMVVGHTFYAIWPGSLEIFESMVERSLPHISGWDGLFALLSVHEAIMALGLAAFAYVLGPRSTRGMRWIHVSAFGITALAALAPALVDATLMVGIGCVVAIAAAATAHALRSPLPLLPGHFAVLTTVAAFFFPAAAAGPTSAAILATNAALAALAWIALRRSKASRSTALVVLTAPMLVALAAFPTTLYLLSEPPHTPWAGLGGLCAAMALGFSALTLRNGALATLATLGGFVAGHLAISGAIPTTDARGVIDLLGPFAALSAFGLIAAWIGVRRTSGDTDETSVAETFSPAFWALFGVSVGAAILWSAMALGADGPIFALVPLGIAASTLADLVLRARRPTEYRHWIGISLLALAGLPMASLFLGCRALGADPMAISSGDPSFWLFGFSLALLAIRSACHGSRFTYLVERVYGRAERRPMELLQSVADSLWRGTAYTAVVACLLFAGPYAAALVLGHLALAWWARRRQDAGGAAPAVPVEAWGLIAIPQLALIGHGSTILVATLGQVCWQLAPWLAGFAWIWLVLALDSRRADGRESPSWVRDAAFIVEPAAAFSLIMGLALDQAQAAASFAVALLFAARHGFRALGIGRATPAAGDDSTGVARSANFQPARHGWAMQAWIGIAVLQARAIAWIELSATATAFGLVGLALALRWARDVLDSRGHTELASTFGPTAALTAAWGGLIPLGQVSGSPWLALLPTFLASLAFALSAHARLEMDQLERHPDQRHDDGWWMPVVAAVSFFVLGFSASIYRLEMAGPELYLLGPGLALLALATLLRERIGATWSQGLVTVGAGCLYAMPVLGMLGEITWGWQITLLLLSVIFGVWSFHLESRALLLVSTLSVLTDLAFFLLMLRRTEPMLLWVAGIAFGLGLMAFAALLEKRREDLRQQFRLWSDELRSWA